MERKIVWQPWVDPFGTNVDDFEYGYEYNPDKADDRPYRDSYEDLIESQQKKQQRSQNQNSGMNGPVLVGPLGVIPLNEHNIPSKVFNFWLAHCNFEVTPRVKDILERIPGVETLEIFTRYRFRLSVGKAFEFREVRVAIQEALCPKISAEVAQERPVSSDTEMRAQSIETVKKTMKKKYPFWAIALLPEGEIQTAGGDTMEMVEAKVQEYMKTEGTKILTSWETNARPT